MTYSLLDGAKLLELLAKSIFISVPGEAAAGSALAIDRQGGPTRNRTRELTYPMKSLDILIDLYYLGILAASLNVRAHSHKRVRQRHGVDGEYTETDGTRITQRKIHSRQNRRAPQSQGRER